MKILFLCRGNIARSQIAAALFKKWTGDNFEVASAGTKLSKSEQPIKEFGSIVENLITVMQEEGVDISRNVCKQVDEEMADEADKIILIVDDEDPVPDYLIENSKVTRWDIPDPKGKSLEFYREVIDKIKELVKKLIRKLERRNSK